MMTGGYGHWSRPCRIYALQFHRGYPFSKRSTRSYFPEFALRLLDFLPGYEDRVFPGRPSILAELVKYIVLCRLEGKVSIDGRSQPEGVHSPSTSVGA